MTLVAFSPRCLTAADVEALRPRILQLIRSGAAERWNLDMSMHGYARITVLGRRARTLFAITKDRGSYRVVGGDGRPLLLCRRIENVLAVLT